MAYKLISRRGPSDLAGLSSLWDSLKTGVRSGIRFYGQAQQNAGAAQQAALQPPALPVAQAGISTNTLLMLGGGALALALILRRKSS